ncbi:hypothetical protein LA080_016461 [Diaporthe eres]|nr:hypothetical protein LA080_016461 [Diaporthe eres]
MEYNSGVGFNGPAGPGVHMAFYSALQYHRLAAGLGIDAGVREYALGAWCRLAIRAFLHARIDVEVGETRGLRVPTSAPPWLGSNQRQTAKDMGELEPRCG